MQCLYVVMLANVGGRVSPITKVLVTLCPPTVADSVLPMLLMLLMLLLLGFILAITHYSHSVSWNGHGFRLGIPTSRVTKISMYHIELKFCNWNICGKPDSGFSGGGSNVIYVPLGAVVQSSQESGPQMGLMLASQKWKRFLLYFADMAKN